MATQSHFARKRTIVSIADAIKKDVSYYIFVVSVINVGLGAATTLMLYAVGVEDALLWGVLAGILNFAPYVGPILFGVILASVAMVQFDTRAEMGLPVLLFYCINLVESQFVTPSAVGSRLRINPLLVILSLLVAGWLWGAVGMLLAVPLLVCIKIVSMHTRHQRQWRLILESC